MALRSRPVRKDRMTRFAVFLWGGLGVLLVAGLIRAVISVGIFTWTTPVSPGVCRAVPLAGAGALALDAPNRMLFAATDNALYATALGAKDAKPVKAVKQ